MWGEGPARAKLVLIGQAPEKTEIKLDRPFVGPTGLQLDVELSVLGLKRSELFVTNAVKCYVKAGTEVPSKAIDCCMPLLQRELDLLPEAKTYLTFGGPAFYGLTGKTLTIATNRKKPNVWLRGCPWTLSYTGRRAIIPTFHPTYLAYTMRRDIASFRADLAKAARYARGEGEFVQPSWRYNVSDTELQEYIAECIALRDVGLDIETPESVGAEEEELVGQGTGQIQEVGISCRAYEAVGVTPDQIRLLKPLLACPEVRLFVFNGLFDPYHLRAYHELHCTVFDVLLMLQELHSDFTRKNLGIALSLYTDLPYHKNLQTSQPQFYNAADTYGCLMAGWRMIDEMQRLNIYDHFLRQMVPTLRICEDLRTRGPKADVQKAGRFYLLCVKALEQYEKMWEGKLPSINWRSDDQLKTLFGAQKLPVKYNLRKNRKTGARTRTPTVDAKTLEVYRDKHGSQIAGLILLMRKLEKAAEFTQLYQTDGFIRATYGLHFQRQGRIQTRYPDVQNTPEALVPVGKNPDGSTKYAVYPREILVGDTEDDAIVLMDYAQIELRLYAIQAREQALLAEIKKGTYIYGLTYEAIYKRPFFVNVPDGAAKAKKYKAPYVTAKELLNAKTGPLGWIYGREDYTETGMTKMESQLFGQSMHKGFPAISAFQRKLDQDVRKQGYLRNPFNRIRPVANPYLMRNDYLSFMGQGTAVDILIRNVLQPLHKTLHQFGERTRMVLTVYDSVGVNVTNGRKDRKLLLDVCNHIRRCAEAPLEELDGHSIPVELRAGPSWGEGEAVEGTDEVLQGGDR